MSRSDTDKFNVFISYSRVDSVIADALVDELTQHGFEVSIDRRNLPFGEKWQSELAEFIRVSDTVVWLVSEASVRSEWVNWELDEVARRSKRLVPVLVDVTARDALPRQLGEIHILPAEGLFDLRRDLPLLVQVLTTDQKWLKEGSRLADRAHEWITKGRNSGLLLGRTALKSAEAWKDQRPRLAPSPDKPVLELILASRQHSTLRQRQWAVMSTIAAAGAIALALFAFDQKDKAEAAQQGEKRQRELAELRLLESQKAQVNSLISQIDIDIERATH